MAREIITRSLMVMSLPGRVLALGANMDEPFPELLRELHDADLTALVSRFEPAAPAPDVTGARDWSVFDERMHYIAHLFSRLPPARGAPGSGLHPGAGAGVSGRDDPRRHAVGRHGPADRAVERAPPILLQPSMATRPFAVQSEPQRATPRRPSSRY